MPRTDEAPWQHIRAARDHAVGAEDYRPFLVEIGVDSAEAVKETQNVHGLAYVQLPAVCKRAVHPNSTHVRKAAGRKAAAVENGRALRYLQHRALTAEKGACVYR